jgi:hypothetical protein
MKNIIKILVLGIFFCFTSCSTKSCFEGFIIINKYKSQTQPDMKVYVIRSFYEADYKGKYKEFEIITTDDTYNVGDKLSLVKVLEKNN